MKSIGTCDDCRFLMYSTGKTYCARMPPTVEGWPPCSPDDFCGEFSAANRECYHCEHGDDIGGCMLGVDMFFKRIGVKDSSELSDKQLVQMNWIEEQGQQAGYANRRASCEHFKEIEGSEK